MRILILYNPRAGAGRAARAAEVLARRLVEAGHDATRLESCLQPPQEWLEPALAGRELLVVVGGDGAMRLALSSAVATGIPLYHYPFGTENLFARQFGMRPAPSDVLDAIARGRVLDVDVGRANDHWFGLMVSVGYDADVIHDLSARRGASISHLSYTGPLLRRLWQYDAPPITIRADGETLVEDGRGVAIVANSRQYAMRIDPALRASMTDGKLDVVFLPATTRRALLGWLIACRTRRHLGRKRLIYHQARDVELISGSPRAYQLDGDPPEPADPPARGAPWSLRITVSDRPLRVLAVDAAPSNRT